MKRVYTNILGALAVLLFFSSCEKTDGALYSGAPNKISFFSTTTSLNMTGGELKVPVGRTSTSGELSVPVTVTASGAGYTNVFTMAGPIAFASGEAKSYAIVKYGDFSVIDPSALSVTEGNNNDVNVGLAFPFSLNIADDNISPANKKKIDVLASNKLEFGAPVTTTMDSYWAEKVIDIQIAKANGANVFKVISPFGFRSFAFMIKSDGKTVVCPNQVIDDGGALGLVTMANVTGTISNGKVTLKPASYLLPDGRGWAGGNEIITMPAGFLD
ncbi:hypothetical protein [Niabella aquatica]